MANSRTAAPAMTNAPPVNVTAAPAAPLSLQLAEVRARIADLNRQLATAKDARVPKTVAIERVDAWLTTLADRQNDKAFAAEFTWREEQSVSLFSSMFFEEQVEAMFGWATGKLMRERLICELDSLYAKFPKGGELDDASRAQSEAGLSADLFDAEVAEERLVSAIEASGMTVNRRAGASAAAILAA